MSVPAREGNRWHYRHSWARSPRGNGERCMTWIYTVG